MRWMLSRTAISGRPTRMVLGSPPAASTSTSTGTASMPTRAKVLSLASMVTSTRGLRLLPEQPLSNVNQETRLDQERHKTIHKGSLDRSASPYGEGRGGRTLSRKHRTLPGRFHTRDRLPVCLAHWNGQLGKDQRSSVPLFLTAPTIEQRARNDTEMLYPPASAAATSTLTLLAPRRKMIRSQRPIKPRPVARRRVRHDDPGASSMFDLRVRAGGPPQFGLDGWLLYDFRGINVLARRVLGLDADSRCSRRLVLLRPGQGRAAQAGPSHRDRQPLDALARREDDLSALAGAGGRRRRTWSKGAREGGDGVRRRATPIRMSRASTPARSSWSAPAASRSSRRATWSSSSRRPGTTSSGRCTWRPRSTPAPRIDAGLRPSSPSASAARDRSARPRCSGDHGPLRNARPDDRHPPDRRRRPAQRRSALRARRRHRRRRSARAISC